MNHPDVIRYIMTADETCHALFNKDRSQGDPDTHAKNLARVQMFHEVGAKLFGPVGYYAALTAYTDNKRRQRFAKWAESGFPMEHK